VPNISFISSPPNAQIKVIGSATPTPAPSCPLPTGHISYNVLMITSPFSRVVELVGSSSLGGAGHTIVEYTWYIDNEYVKSGPVVEIIIDLEQHNIKLKIKNDCGKFDYEFKIITPTYIPTPTPSPTPIYTPSPTPPTTKLNQFRQSCISNGTVNVGWNTLKPYMIDRTVSEIWWYLTEKERRSILKLTDSNNYPTSIPSIGEGQDDCKGSYNNWTFAWCRNHVTIKLHIYGKPVTDNSKSFYYQTKSNSKHCYYTNQYYDLPYNYVAIRGPEINGTEYFAHAVCGVQVNQDTSTYNSWVLFQYWDHDIKPNSYQIPTNKYDLTMYIYKYIDLPSLDKISYSKLYTFKL